MPRLILGAVLGDFAWFVVVIGLSLALRAAAPHLSAALNVHATAAALGGRLAISFLASIVSGLVAAFAGTERSRAPLASGVLLLIGFGYYHVTMIWDQFPLWYHLTFFVSLPLLSLLGGRLKSA